ncbi:polysaccharide biosynthesis protein [Cyanobium sp. BA5m-21]|uniref:polysaccharide biosynthesis protein n=1 Tax=Cyanobium sp. BA5m-21 TaxID=2823706 RepID=UPI0020CCC25C|nr:nucleoside-diphosphate sugar epimerase/dehydratase [Cyanobium sp. BA5m-21]
MELPPLGRRLLLGMIDVLLIPLAIWLSFWLRTAHPFSEHLGASLWLFPVVWTVGLSVYAFTGQYRGLTRYVSSTAFYALATRNAAVVVLVYLLGTLLPVQMPPRSSWPLLWLLLTGLTGGTRFVLRDLLLRANHTPSNNRPQVMIYGAGAAAAQLAAALRLARSHTVAAFIDDDPGLWRRELDGIAIRAPQMLPELVNSHQVSQVLLAIPSLSRSKRRRIVQDIQQLGVSVLQVPSLEEITSGQARINTLRPVAIEELLGRDAVPPDPNLLGPGVRGSVVAVTGAGGSIGSELCRQILRLGPKALVLLERSEPALYAIHQELKQQLPEGLDLVPVLGNAADAALMQRCFAEQAVDVVFHAAAYKHVPLVEANPLAGLTNNVQGTRVIGQAALDQGLRQMVLISTDKAVRPTNVMGASKREAELVVQGLAEQADRQGASTRFAMVRFGNVLGSSGSVVPLFRKQIAAGGPITLTHPEIIRFFMTIPEAAQLVLQAAALAEGGDLFLLDMGEPVRILDLARQMVRLSGLRVRDAHTPDGDIEISCTGLRPGEKLYEELLIEASSEATPHPLIYRAREASLPPEQLWPQLDALEAAIRCQDASAALDLLAQLVPEWQRGEVGGQSQAAHPTDGAHC